VLAGDLTWREQLPLAERWTVEIVERVGYGRSRVLSPGEDIELDGQLVAEMLGTGAHLIGQSSGAVVAMLAAARRPEGVLSLTLSEPPTFQLAPDSAEAQAMMRGLQPLFRIADDVEFLRRFVELVGSNAVIPDKLPPPLLDGTRAVRAGRRVPWEIALPLDELGAAKFPKLVVSGDHSAAFEAVCDSLAERIGAERAHVRGARHTTPHTGASFNERLEAFLRSGESGHRSSE
jgi:pimeloyl-ACP methyl ester carboxylesterase